MIGTTIVKFTFYICTMQNNHNLISGYHKSKQQIFIMLSKLHILLKFKIASNITPLFTYFLQNQFVWLIYPTHSVMPSNKPLYDINWHIYINSRWVTMVNEKKTNYRCYAMKMLKHFSANLLISFLFLPIYTIKYLNSITNLLIFFQLEKHDKFNIQGKL